MRVEYHTYRDPDDREAPHDPGYIMPSKGLAELVRINSGAVSDNPAGLDFTVSTGVLPDGLNHGITLSFESLDEMREFAASHTAETGPPPLNKDTPLPPGLECWFEYHCLESPDSGDADLWYRSHSRVTIIDRGDDEVEIDEDSDTFEKRMIMGHPINYRIRFQDGSEATALEDELLGSPAEFTRPAPPPRP